MYLNPQDSQLKSLINQKASHTPYWDHCFVGLNDSAMNCCWISIIALNSTYFLKKRSRFGISCFVFRSSFCKILSAVISLFLIVLFGLWFTRSRAFLFSGSSSLSVCSSLFRSSNLQSPFWLYVNSKPPSNPQLSLSSWGSCLIFAFQSISSFSALSYQFGHDWMNSKLCFDCE